MREDHVPQDLLSVPSGAHPVQALGRLGTKVVTLLRELDKAVEDCPGPLDLRPVPAQDDLVPAHDDLTPDQVLDAPQDRVPVPEDLQHESRRHHQLGLYLTPSRNVRLPSLNSYYTLNSNSVAARARAGRASSRPLGSQRERSSGPSRPPYPSCSRHPLRLSPRRRSWSPPRWKVELGGSDARSRPRCLRPGLALRDPPCGTPRLTPRAA